VVIKVLSLIR